MKLPECEIERDRPLTPGEKFLGALAAVSLVLGLALVALCVTR